MLCLHHFLLQWLFCRGKKWSHIIRLSSPISKALKWEKTSGVWLGHDFTVEGLDRGALRGLMFDPDDCVKYCSPPPLLPVNLSTELEPFSRLGQSDEMWARLVAEKLVQITLVSLQGARAHMSHPELQVNSFMWQTNGDMWERSESSCLPFFFYCFLGHRFLGSSPAKGVGWLMAVHSDS